MALSPLVGRPLSSLVLRPPAARGRGGAGQNRGPRDRFPLAPRHSGGGGGEPRTTPGAGGSLGPGPRRQRARGERRLLKSPPPGAPGRRLRRPRGRLLPYPAAQPRRLPEAPRPGRLTCARCGGGGLTCAPRRGRVARARSAERSSPVPCRAGVRGRESGGSRRLLLPRDPHLPPTPLEATWLRWKHISLPALPPPRNVTYFKCDLLF